MEPAVVQFENADPMWIEEHPAEVTRLATELTEAFRERRLPIDMAKRVADAIHRHDHVLLPHMPMDLKCHIGEVHVLANSLLFGTSSPYFLSLLRNGGKIAFDLPLPLFREVIKFVHTGKVRGLWRETAEEIITILKQAQEWGLSGLALYCEEYLNRYIDRASAIPMLLQAHNSGWENLKMACGDFLNTQQFGLRFPESPDLAVEFLDFRESTLDLYASLSPYATRLIFGANLTADRTLGKILAETPKLVALDLSGSRRAPTATLPPTLQELDLVMCPWLNFATLATLLEAVPSLQRLSLANNPQLEPRAFQLLQRLPALQELDVSRSPQIGDEELGIIAHAAYTVTHWNLSGCPLITDAGFSHFAKLMPEIEVLDLSATRISDVGLLAFSECKQLHKLSCDQCPEITQRGIRLLPGLD